MRTSSAIAQFRAALHQPCAGLTQHHAACRSDGFHPLCHADLVTDRCVTARAGPDLTRDNLAGIDTNAQPECHSVASHPSAASASAACWISSAARQARNAWSSNAAGAPNSAIRPSRIAVRPPLRSITAADVLPSGIFVPLRATRAAMSSTAQRRRTGSSLLVLGGWIPPRDNCRERACSSTPQARHDPLPIDNRGDAVRRRPYQCSGARPERAPRNHVHPRIQRRVSGARRSQLNWFLRSSYSLTDG